MANNYQHILGLATNSSFQILSINIKLETSNFCLWRTTIISALETLDLESFILHPNPPPKTITITQADAQPTVEANPDYLLWKKRDRYVLLWLKSTLAERALAIISLGHLLSGLDSSYGSFVVAVMMKDNIASVDDLIGLLLQEEARLEQEHPRQSVVVPPPAKAAAPLALNFNRQHRFNSSHSGSPAPQSLGNRSGSIAPRRQRMHCQLCNKPGHEVVDCWQRSNLVDYPSRKSNPRAPSARQARVA
ncbi:hypothetical protein LXL04_002473 [Taraxacum kok-saghyz]